MKPNIYHRMRKRIEGIEGKDKEESRKTLFQVLLKTPTTHDQNKIKTHSIMRIQLQRR